MNDRIVELAKQAGYQEDMFGIGHWQMQEFEIFVSLLVRECADIAMLQHSSDSFFSYDDLNDYERGCDDTASTISGNILSRLL